MKKRISFSAVLLVLFSLGVPIFGYLLWRNRSLPAAASAHGPGIDAMLNYLLLTTGLMVLAGHIILAIFIWRFSRQDEISHRMVSRKTEWKWAILPIVLMTFVAEGGVLIIGLPVWKQMHVKEEPANALTVDVMAEQFAWNFRYAGPDGEFGRLDPKYFDDENKFGIDPDDEAGEDDVVESGVMTVPVDRPLRVRLRSKDVIHGFFLPHQRVKQDAVPGMVVDTWVTPTQTGTFEILCTELCGLGHYQMRGLLEVLEADAFDEWVAEAADDDW